MTQPILLINDVYAVEAPDNTVHTEIIDKESLPPAIMVYIEDKNNYFKPGIPFPIRLPPGSWQLIGTTKECTITQAKEIVERDLDGWKDYSEGFHHDLPFPNAIASLNSLLASKSIDPNTNYVLIKKLK